jgi:hypothetical protein
MRHVVIGDFGRNIPNALDTVPAMKKEAEEAEQEAKNNYKSP